MGINQLTAHELHELLIRREVSCEEITRAVFDRIEEVEESIHAYITLTGELAFQQAKVVDRKLKAGEPIPVLAGIPVAIKDVICTEGIRTTCASKILANWEPPYNATVVEKMAAADMVIVGKTNMDEFAMGSSTENSAFGPTRNPWNLEYVPGGSSGGSAASVAADECIVSLGSDTGGSIRQPGAFCGVVGLKPTYGRVSRYGLVAFASSLDQIGPITKDVLDCALMMNLIAGHDRRDSTSAPLGVPDFVEALVDDVKGMKLGVPKEFMGEGIAEDVKKAVWAAVELLAGLGASYEEISMPHIEYSLPTYYLIAPAEASSNLARYDGVQYGYRTKRPAGDIIEMYERTRDEGFGAEVKRRIMLGTYALSAGYYDAYYLKAQKVRTLVKRDFDEAFGRFDVLITPTSPTVAFKLGEKTADPLEMYLSDVCTIPINLAGIPAISIPCGFSNGLPIGLQILGRPFDEASILRVAYVFEQHTGYHKVRPRV